MDDEDDYDENPIDWDDNHHEHDDSCQRIIKKETEFDLEDEWKHRVNIMLTWEK